MRFTCLLCHNDVLSEPALFLCPACYASLEPTKGDSEICTLFRYNAPLRQLILRAKIHGDYRALACLNGLVLSSSISAQIAAHCQIISPAPSSFWSRIRGKVDLAWLLSSALARQSNIHFARPPLHLYWRFKKRSKTQFREEVDLSEFASRDSQRKNILIFDDIVTSGHTLRKTALAIRNTNCYFLALANARHKVSYD